MSRIPRGTSARRFIQALIEDGFTLDRTRGSHRIYIHSDGRRVIVAAHLFSETVPVGTLKRMIADARWNEEDLMRLGLLK